MLEIPYSSVRKSCLLTDFYQKKASETITNPQTIRTAPIILYPSSLLAAPVGAEVAVAAPEEVLESAAAMTSEESAETASFCAATGACVERESRVGALVVMRKPCSS